MALQDTEAFPGGQSPYPFGSPEYQAMILPFLEQQLQDEAHRASNARGTFYSGPAMADEQQAASNLVYQMAQQGAQQSEAERMTKEQQQFESDQRAKAAQDASDLARKQASGGAINAAIGGTTQSAGTLAGLYAMTHMGPHAAGLPGPSGEVLLNDSHVYSPLENPTYTGGPGAGSFVSGGGEVNAPSAASFSGGHAVADTDAAINAVAAHPTGLSSLWSGAGAADAAAALPAALWGNQVGDRTFGGGTRSDVGSGLFGLLGGAGGGLVGGPAGAAAGAAAGSFLGPELMKHPGEATPWTLPLAIPAVRNTMRPVGNAINKAGQDVANFFTGLF